MLKMSVTMLDALVAARILQYTAKKGNSVSMLCASVTINALLSLILTKGDAMSLTPAYYAYQLISEHLNGEIYEYLQAASRLEFSVDGRYVKNPTCIDIYVDMLDEKRIIPAGKTVKILD